MFLWWIEASVIFSQRFLRRKMIYHRILWNIQTKRQNRNWNVTNAFIAVFLFSRNVYGAILASALSFWLVFFLQRLFMWSSKDSFESKTLPSSSFLFSDMMALLSILTLIMSFLEKSQWLLAQLILMYCNSNNLKRIRKSAPDLLIY